MFILALIFAIGIFSNCSKNPGTSRDNQKVSISDSTNHSTGKKYNVMKTNEEWQNKLSEEQYHVTREKGTERPFKNKYWDNHENGIYKCVCCGQELFSSDTKFESGTGWPSFFKPIKHFGFHTQVY